MTFDGLEVRPDRFMLSGKSALQIIPKSLGLLSINNGSQLTAGRFCMPSQKEPDIFAMSTADLAEIIANFSDSSKSTRDVSRDVSIKRQWLGWLAEYQGPGYYGRKTTGNDARFAYNHLQNHEMLLWLLKAAGLPAAKLKEARARATEAKTPGQKAAAVRRIASWDDFLSLLWPHG